ncbi:hypothetical protein Chor_016266 [Crotalus horridus]
MTDSAPETEGRSEDGRKERTCPSVTGTAADAAMRYVMFHSNYEVTSTKYTRDIYKELLISLVASLFMGFGVLFLLLWVGIYV